jgi:1,2-phenylacetyl-CoA epoxidase catalytic subunit
MQAALDLAWPYIGQVFNSIHRPILTDENILPDPEALVAALDGEFRQFFTEIDLKLPDTGFLTLSRDLPSQHLIDILAELQQVARTDPDARW